MSISHDDFMQAQSTIADLERQLAEAREALKHCGQENCMGYKTRNAATWVREERLIEATGLLGELLPLAEDDPDGALEPEGVELLGKVRAILGEKGA